MGRNSNELGFAVEPQPLRRPEPVTLTGQWTEVRPLALEADHHPLTQALRGQDTVWDYMAEGPFLDAETWDRHLQTIARSNDPLYFAVMLAGQAAGWLSLMRSEPHDRVVEIGNIVFSPSLQRTREATEAIFLVARYVFELLAYRRLEWKCNALNRPSRRAAERYGFQFEGLFRQHRIVKGRNRDTAWYSLLDSEWPGRKAAFERWLQPANFDGAGRQRQTLGQCAG